MENSIHYTLGFAFNTNLDKVLLIKKNRPEFQKGKLNGIGGKIEKNEMPSYGQIREFKEETGINTSLNDWRLFSVINGKSYKNHYRIYCFTITTDLVFTAKTVTDEDVLLVDRKYLNEINIMPNLQFLIPLTFIPIEHPIVFHIKEEN